MSNSAPVRMTKSKSAQALEIVGDPGWIRTSDLQLRRLLQRTRLNPIEHDWVSQRARQSGLFDLSSSLNPASKRLNQLVCAPYVPQLVLIWPTV